MFARVCKTFLFAGIALVLSTAVRASSPSGAAFSPVYDAYFEIQVALAKDDLAAAKAGYAKLGQAVSKVELPAGLKSWGDARKAIEQGSAAKTLDDARESLKPLSEGIVELVQSSGPVGAEPYRLFECPMAAKNTGARWIQKKTEAENPYMGQAMLTCGVFKETLAASGQ